MDLEVQINALHSAEQEYNHYARYINMISGELHQVRRQLADLSGMDYAMLRLRALEGRLDASRDQCRKTAETLEFAARKYATADSDVKNRTPDNIKALRSLIERLRPGPTIDPLHPSLPWQLRRTIWEYFHRRRYPTFTPGWVPFPGGIPVWIIPPRPQGPPFGPGMIVPMPIPPMVPGAPKPHVPRVVGGFERPILINTTILIDVHPILK